MNLLESVEIPIKWMTKGDPLSDFDSPSHLFFQAAFCPLPSEGRPAEGVTHLPSLSSFMAAGHTKSIKKSGGVLVSVLLPKKTKVENHHLILQMVKINRPTTDYTKPICFQDEKRS